MSQQIRQNKFIYDSSDDIDYSNPKSLFKYFSLGGSKNKKRLLSSIQFNRFWFSRRSNFNDPFDSMLWFENPISKAKNEQSEDIARDRMQKFIHSINDIGIFCLSATPFELLMWSHYADAHKGICVEFERTPSNQLGSSKCCRISYRDSLRILRKVAPENIEQLGDEVIFSKRPFNIETQHLCTSLKTPHMGFCS